jgi:transposase
MQPITIGLDLAEARFSAARSGGRLPGGAAPISTRAELLAFFKALPSCVISMEACLSSHYSARELSALGHTKSDAIDAQAICEAVARPTMRIVLIKNAEQQSAVMLHRTRDLLVRQRTMLVNAPRGHLGEFR